MDSPIQRWKLRPILLSAVQDLSLEPTALLTTVLTRTTTDFADVLVDGRCATGSSTVGTAAAIWIYNSNSLNTPGGHNLPLYKTPAAIRERQVLTTLYAVHCLLTNLTSRARNQRGGIGSGGTRGIEVSILLAASDVSIEPLYELAKSVGTRCKVEVSLVRHSESFYDAMENAIKAASGGETSAECALSAPAGSNDDSATAGFLLVATLKNFLGWNSADFARGLVAHPHTESTDASAKGEQTGEGVPRCFAGVVPHVSALVAEDIGGLHPGTADETRWHDITGGMLVAAERAHARSITVTHLLPHFMWLCLGPLSSLSPLVRSRLSRRNRRHYPLLPNSYVSPSAALARHGPGTTMPMENINMRYLLYLDEKDREEQLCMILKQNRVFRRALLLTHHKDIRQLSSKIQASGLYGSANRNLGLTPSADSAVDTTAALASGGGQVNATDGHQYYILRSDASDRQHNLLLSFTQSKNEDSTLLIGWDTCTAADLMDVDVLIQYYPPQKSLTEQEWAEFIQILHTTGDGELKIESTLRSNPNNSEQHVKLKVAQLRVGLSTSSPLITSRCRQSPVIITFISSSDFSLCAHFIQQYYYSGGTGSLSPAAIASNLSAVTTTPGQPGVWLPSTDPAHTPILNICASHPLFLLLVTGPEEAHEGVPRGPAPYPCGMEDPVTIRNVLKVKLQKEREMLGRAGPRGANSAGGPNGSSFPNLGNSRNSGGHGIATHSIVNSVMTNNDSSATTALGGSGKNNVSLPLHGSGGAVLTNTSNGNGPGGQSSRKVRRGNRNSRRRGLSVGKTPGNATDLEQDKPSIKPISSLPANASISASKRETANDSGRDKSGGGNDNTRALNSRVAGTSQRQLKVSGAARRSGKRKSRSDTIDDQLNDKQLSSAQGESGSKKEEDAPRAGNDVPQRKCSVSEIIASTTVTGDSAGDTDNKQGPTSNLDTASRKKTTAHVVGGMLEKIGVKAHVEPRIVG